MTYLIIDFLFHNLVFFPHNYNFHKFDFIIKSTNDLTFDFVS